MLRKTAIASGTFSMSATAIVMTDKPKQPAAVQEKDEHAHYKCKPSDLPLYSPLHSPKRQSDHADDATDSSVRQNLEGGISVVRKQVFGAYDAIVSQKKVLDDTWSTGKEHTRFVVDYLNEPSNTIPRVGAVAIGGLAGFIFSLRGGFIRRVLFTGLGAAGVASICYPKEAEIYAQHGIVEAKKYSNIAYNFAFGVKPGDDVNTPDWPKIPTSFSELSESISNVAKSAKDALFSSKK